jgi:hypothetical protein
MPRPQYSHLDNDGVKGLVDSICSRMRTGASRHERLFGTTCPKWGVHAGRGPASVHVAHRLHLPRCACGCEGGVMYSRMRTDGWLRLAGSIPALRQLLVRACRVRLECVRPPLRLGWTWAADHDRCAINTELLPGWHSWLKAGSASPLLPDPPLHPFLVITLLACMSLTTPVPVGVRHRADAVEAEPVWRHSIKAGGSLSPVAPAHSSLYRHRGLREAYPHGSYASGGKGQSGPGVDGQVGSRGYGRRRRRCAVPTCAIVTAAASAAAAHTGVVAVCSRLQAMLKAG